MHLTAATGLATQAQCIDIRPRSVRPRLSWAVHRGRWGEPGSKVPIPALFVSLEKGPLFWSSCCQDHLSGNSGGSQLLTREGKFSPNLDFRSSFCVPCPGHRAQSGSLSRCLGEPSLCFGLCASPHPTPSVPATRVWIQTASAWAS